MKRQLRKHQKRAFYYGSAVQHPALYMEMRLGKTLVAIRLTKYWNAHKILIVCPYSAYKGWLDELEAEGEDEWGIVQLLGSKEMRYNIFDSKYDNHKWFLINKEGYLVIPEIAHSRYIWDCVVIDESTCIKTHDTKISKFYSENFRDVPHRCILTGTPAPESDLDYYSQLRFLDPKILDNMSYWQFRNFAFGQIGFDVLISPRGSKFLSQRLAKYCFFMSRADVNLGGEKIYKYRYIQMPNSIRKIYNRIAKDFILEIEDNIKDSTVFACTKFLWLRRLCGGFVDGEFVYHNKLTELIYLLHTELKDQQIIVWCRFTEEIEYITEKLNEQGFKAGHVYGKVNPQDRIGIQRAFDEKLIQVLVAQPKCFKYGVNLSSASTMIYYSLDESLETFLQSQDRTIDVSNKEGCLILFLIADKTIEENIVKSLRNKNNRQQLMKSIVQGIQQSKKACNE